jgi:hypothetical protein
MALSKTDWETLETKIVTDWQKGVNIGSHSLSNITISYRSLSEQLEVLKYVRQQIASLTPNSRAYSLVRFINA